MSTLAPIPLLAITSLSAEQAVTFARSLLRAECAYAKISPSALTISSRINVADGGIDAESVADFDPPSDCLIRRGVCGFQIKSGASFKPWTDSSIRSELVNSNGELYSEVRRLVERGGAYILLCTGHDLTPEQRNDARELVASLFEEFGFQNYESRIEVLGASQVADFAERYPGTAAVLSISPSQDAWVLEEWKCDAHLANAFEHSDEQVKLITTIRTRLREDAKHLRILGEPGLGKTRVVMEALNDTSFAPYVLYFQHGTTFSSTQLFRLLLRSGWTTPLILVLDELPESELSEIWRHLKPRCGYLKLVTIDHGRDEAFDSEIERLSAPVLSDKVIRSILASHVGDHPALDRWVSICEGSPRVAQAVAENLLSNPDDLLRAPSTIPLWSRFLHGYGQRDEFSARQVDCVALHLALFSRFGFEPPVAEEARFIWQLVSTQDTAIGWGRFQEIIQTLRGRRVLQGRRTLFFVPKALHIHLWKKYWTTYGRTFDFTTTFTAMPETLRGWFLSRFRFADDEASLRVIVEILAHDGIFSTKEVLTSGIGTRFLSTLSEANPGAVLGLLEATIGQWSDSEIFEFTTHRQSIVWALEKIAVWPKFTCRSIKMLTALALHENATFTNNSTGTLVSLFRIGPEWAATEATPQVRLPALIDLLKGPTDDHRRLGLKCASAALSLDGGSRTIGPEFQGLKDRANLWAPATYGDWWDIQRVYFEAVLEETARWPEHLQTEVSTTLLKIVRHQLRSPGSMTLALQVLSSLTESAFASASDLNQFFSNWLNYRAGENAEVDQSVRSLANRFWKSTVASRFQKYVLDLDWLDWDDDRRSRLGKSKLRSQELVRALTGRIVKCPSHFEQIKPLLERSPSSPAGFYFGKNLSERDVERRFLPDILKSALESRQTIFLFGYLDSLRSSSEEVYRYIVLQLMERQSTAWLGVRIALNDPFDPEIFELCVRALRKNWITPRAFEPLRVDRNVGDFPLEKVELLLTLFREIGDAESLEVSIEILDSERFRAQPPCNDEFLLDLLHAAMQAMGDREEHMPSFHWMRVSSSLLERTPGLGIRVLQTILAGMERQYRLSYDSQIGQLANSIVSADPEGAWSVISSALEDALPKWRTDIFKWLQGGHGVMDGEPAPSAVCSLRVDDVIAWVQVDPEARAGLIAHCVHANLDDAMGGLLTRELLTRWGADDSVRSGLFSTLHSGSFTGKVSSHYRKKRETLRNWLSRGFHQRVNEWIESEIETFDRQIEHEETREERDRFE